MAKHKMGIGHHIPPQMSNKEYAKLKKKWEKKLEKSGFVDIEQSDDEGFMYTTFARMHGMTSNSAASSQLRRWSQETQDYYYQASVFLTCFDWSTLTKKNYPEISEALNPADYRNIWELFCEGHSTEMVWEKCQSKKKLGRWGTRNMINVLRKICGFFNRNDPNGALFHSDF